MSGGDLSRVREGTADLDPVMASHQHPPPRQQSHHQQEAHQQHCSSAETTSPNNTARGAGATYGKMEPADDFPAGLRILVVDDDPTCLAILKKMLQQCSYQVTTCGRATRALELLREDKDKFDLVISDVYMPDMDGFKLLELVGLEMDLPVIMMSGNGETSVVMKGITHGACDYLLKPVRIEELSNIWQHVVRKLRSEPKEHSASLEDGDRQRRGGAEDADNTSSAADTADGIWRNKKKKEAKDDEEDFEQDNDDPSTLKKPRVVWSVELHQQFVSAVNQLGIDKAVPKRILELMSVQGLTRENVASHLQKYRLYLKRLSGVTSQSNSLNVSFGGPDAGYGGLFGLDEMSDYRNLVTNAHLPAQTIAALHHANMAGRLGASSGMAGPSSPLDPSVLAQIAALQSGPLPRPGMDGSLQGNQAGLLQSLSGALDYNSLHQSHLLPAIGQLGQLDELPSLKSMQHQLGMGSLGVSTRNLAGSPNEELTMQLLQQRAQQQSGGSPINLPQATGILRPLSSNINQGGSVPNLVGVIPGTAIGLSNMCSGGREFGSSSGLLSASGSLMRSSTVEAQNLNFGGSSGSSGCSFQASVLSSKTGGLEDLNPAKRVRTTYSALSHSSPDLGQSSRPAWLGSQEGLVHGDPVYSPHQLSLPRQDIVGGIGSSGRPAYMGSQSMGSLGMNFPLSLAVDAGAVRPSLTHGQSLTEQVAANRELKFPKEERGRDNLMCARLGGGMITNESSSEELLNYLKQSHEGLGFMEGDLVSDGYPVDNLYVK